MGSSDGISMEFFVASGVNGLLYGMLLFMRSAGLMKGSHATDSPSGHHARRNALTRASAANLATREAGANK